MDRLDLIRITHEIDRHLADLTAAVSEENLKRQLAAFQLEWKRLAYAVTADLCGVPTDGGATPQKRRGRRPKAAGASDMNEEPAGAPRSEK